MIKSYEKVFERLVHRNRGTVTPSTIRDIHKILKCAFNNAVKWDLITRNPFLRASPPKYDEKKRNIWTADMISKALQECDDPLLSLAIHLSFACSMRLGEILGLQWKNVHIEDSEIKADNAYIDITCQLETVSRKAMEQIGEDNVFLVFDTDGKNTALVLVPPKTKSSIRKVWLPNTLAEILKSWKEEQQYYKEYFGDSYQDYDLVICHEDGRPTRHTTIRHALKELINTTGLPEVVFHSFRHSSVTYKLKLNQGDIKATQGDTGHSQATMVTDTYSHILDENRKINAQKFDDIFYSYGTEKIDRREDKIDLDKLVECIKTDPALLQKLLDSLK